MMMMIVIIIMESGAIILECSSDDVHVRQWVSTSFSFGIYHTRMGHTVNDLLTLG